MANETCWTVVRSAAGGDATARGVFAKTYLPVIRAYLGARWKGSAWREHTDDAIQDVFVDCFRDNGALGRLDPDRHNQFRTFLYGVVRNVALRYEERGARDKMRQAASAFNPDEQAAGEAQLSRVFDRAWAIALVKRAGDRQEKEATTRDAADGGDDAIRRVKLLRERFGNGRPIRDIAKLWGEDAAILHREYAKAREEFKEALKAEIRYHSPGGSVNVDKECTLLLSLLSLE